MDQVLGCFSFQNWRCIGSRICWNVLKCLQGGSKIGFTTDPPSVKVYFKFSKRLGQQFSRATDLYLEEAREKEPRPQRAPKKALKRQGTDLGTLQKKDEDKSNSLPWKPVGRSGMSAPRRPPGHRIYIYLSISLSLSLYIYIYIYIFGCMFFKGIDFQW